MNGLSSLTNQAMEKTVLITGAEGNLGSAMVRQLLGQGFNVVGTRHATSSPAISSERNPEMVAIDLTDEKATAELINTVVNKYGVLDTAILTVGGFAMGGIEQTVISDIHKQGQLNFVTAYNVAQPVFIHMWNQKKGRIFLVGSRPGMDMRNGRNLVAYALTKSLIFRLAELMNAEAAGMDLITQVIVPSTIDTPQNRASMPEADFSKWVKPEKIAEATFRAMTQPAENRLLLF